MYSSKTPKISQHTRQQIYNLYQQEKLKLNKKSEAIGFKKVYTQDKLKNMFSVSRQTVSKIIKRGRQGDFTIKKPINKRYLTEDCVKKRQVKLELKIQQKLERKDKREEIAKSRYEHQKPGDLGHIDLKLLPSIIGEKKVKGQKEYLLTLVDDCTRISYFTIIQGKNQYQVKSGLEKIFTRCPISFSAILSDNGKEFKGSQRLNEFGKYRPKMKGEGQYHVVELLFQKMNIKHRYTRVRRPQTNGKVERLNRTISEEFLTKVKFENRLHREAELRLWEYHYNQDRNHQGIKNQTPQQKFRQLSPLKFI